ncbi:Uncharacterized protein ALO42_02427 [Pseudomonas syringae pv. atrofaciens]|uniref:CHAT domain-containing protein n=1 Tax=Pseudomonas syringae pv. atrofaciens TaxID=192087 RepID=A0AAD0MWZ5_PSESX|nr:CHAT domain-containing protein [Pseudomonas syringae]AVX22939.1 CHAT domain-containing protein [Pseudomonas syringae pv. atrofaciens]KPW06461.1 Uncharacterized protein ALO42_02427 [Pseudomonas syringae pv. atrofaciens]
MSSNHYRGLVRSHQQRIARLRESHARKLHEAAKHGEASRKAETEATRAQSASTVRTKQQQAQRYDGQRTKAEVDAAKIVADINREMARLLADQQQLDKALERELKEAARKRQTEQQRLNQQVDRDIQSRNRQLNVLQSGLANQMARADDLEREVAKLQQLPEQILILFFGADPGRKSEKALDLQNEIRGVNSHIRASKHRDALKVNSHWAVRAEDLLQALDENEPAVMHFSGHGTSAGHLVLESPNGEPHLVPLEGMLRAIAGSARYLKLAVFNCCHSLELAERCSVNVHAAIGMDGAIADEAAKDFAARFYASIGFGQDIREAFNRATTQLAMTYPGESHIPQLFINALATEADLTLVKA